MVYEKGFAIVGIGCRFPGGVTSLEGLWNVLSGGKDVVTSVPGERFDLARYWHPDRKASGRTCSAGIRTSLPFSSRRASCGTSDTNAATAAVVLPLRLRSDIFEKGRL